MDTSPSPDCSICKGAGFVHPRLPSGKPDFSRVVVCSCRKERLEVERKEWLLQYCELPPMAEDMGLDNFKVYPEVKEAYDVAQRVANHTDELAWVVFMGMNDTGKTHLAVAICREWIERGVVAKYALVPLLLDDLRDGFGKEQDNSYSERFRRYCDVPLLVLDDLGMESRTAWVNEKLEALVDYRYMNKLSLVVTTNKTIDELPTRLGSRLARHPNAKLVVIQATEYTLRRTK